MVGSTLAGTPVMNSSVEDWNGPYVVGEIRWDAKNDLLWAWIMEPNGSTGYSFAYSYVQNSGNAGWWNTGNSLEEAKGIFSALSLARSLNKNVQIRLGVSGLQGGRYRLVGVAIQ
jgi:hypothetical protein